MELAVKDKLVVSLMVVKAAEAQSVKDQQSAVEDKQLVEDKLEALLQAE